MLAFFFLVRDGPLEKLWEEGGWGGGGFSLHEVFFSPAACANFFFAGETLCTKFFLDKY